MTQEPTAQRRVVAIDGPAGAGKSSVAKQLAEALGFTLLDTGALYRAVAVAAKQRGIAWDDQAALGGLAHALAEQDGLRLQPDASALKGTRVWLGEQDVTRAIREPDISMGASRVSAIPEVRSALLALQRNQVRHGGVVAEGRDIGTVVFPDAALKFFLTASLQVRAERRRQELASLGEAPPLSQVIENVRQRDAQDSQRAIAPLRQAADATLVDCSEIPVARVVASMVEAARAVFGEG